MLAHIQVPVAVAEGTEKIKNDTVRQNSWPFSKTHDI